ncbi:MAG: NAD-dependent epimerase/dehydratase family protein [Planctomycetaceae bacterium]|nr:NAD-dependent epimerase/dehydratase family protein [Planctomycetaceae bacterium]
MKALVTGGGGFLGLYIVEQLRAAGHDVRVFSRGLYPALNALGVETLQGDLRDLSAVTNACRGSDAVFHVAAIPGVWGTWDTYHGINTIGTLNVISACRVSDVQRLIYTSSPSVVFDGADHINADESLPYPRKWLCHYPHSKALAEQAVLAANAANGLRTISLRPHLIWGPRDNHLIPRLIMKARAGKLLQVGRGDNIVSVSYVENAAAAHLQAETALRNSLTAAGRAYFINEPDAVNLWSWINLILERAGLPPVTKKISATMAWYAGSFLETAWKLLRRRGDPPMTRFVAAQLSGSHSYSIAAAQRDFGYHPLVTTEEGLRRMQPDLDALTAASKDLSVKKEVRNQA